MKVVGLFFLGVSLALVVLFLGVVAYTQWLKWETHRASRLKPLRLTDKQLSD